MPYSNTVEITGYAANVANKPLVDKLDKNHFGLDDIDWFWRNFMSDNGEGLYATLVEPITGDFNRIAENGNAWKHASNQFRDLSKNLTDNTATLISQHWTHGESSAAYHQHIEIVWVGALWIGEELCTAIAKGFEKISEWSISLAEKAIEVLDRIIKAVSRLAGKAVPAVGQLAGAVEWIASGFQDFPYISDVNRIKSLIDQVYNIHEKIQQMAESVRGYLKACESILEAIKQVPEINSNQDMIEITKSLSTGREEMKEEKKKLTRQKSQLDSQLDRIDSTLNPGKGGNEND